MKFLSNGKIKLLASGMSLLSSIEYSKVCSLKLGLSNISSCLARSNCEMRVANFEIIELKFLSCNALNKSNMFGGDETLSGLTPPRI